MTKQPGRLDLPHQRTDRSCSARSPRGADYKHSRRTEGTDPKWAGGLRYAESMRSARCVGSVAFSLAPLRGHVSSCEDIPLGRCCNESKPTDAGSFQQTMEDVKIKTGFGGACSFLSRFNCSPVEESGPNRLTERSDAMHSDTRLALADRHVDRVGVCRLSESANGQSAVPSICSDLPASHCTRRISARDRALLGLV